LFGTATVAADADIAIQDGDPVTVTIDGVDCYQCFFWNGIGGAPRTADKLSVTLESPTESAKRRIELFVWNLNTTNSKVWVPGTKVTFFPAGDQMRHGRVIVPVSDLLMTDPK
jgi:hypothetical protein